MKLVTYAIRALILLTVLGLGLFGIGRSLWLDEAWVANSILSPSLHGMFYYPAWLQVNPPLFLLLVRAVVQVAGASNAAFRAVPLAMALAAAAMMLAVARRVLASQLAELATALVVFDLIAIEYSRSLKPYSSELAASSALLLATVCYLQMPVRKRFGWLLGAVAVAVPLAYSTVFLLPGVVLAVAFTGSRRRASAIAAIVAVELAAMYAFLIRFNLSPDLRAFWTANPGKLTPGSAAVIAFCALAGVRTTMAFTRKKTSSPDWVNRDLINFVCLLPCLLLLITGAAGWYPVIPRTRLFALPCFILLVMMTIDDVLERLKARKVSGAVAIALTLGLAGFAIANQVIGVRNVTEEDYASAVAFLREHIGPSDVVLVHACCKEGFVLYSRLLYSGLDHWQPEHLLFGDTGWPCCARGKDSGPGSSSESAVIRDLDSKIPRDFRGRVWLLFTTRPTQWDYTGLNEGEVWRNHLWQRGCPPGPYLRFANLAISPADCATPPGVSNQ